MTKKTLTLLVHLEEANLIRCNIELYLPQNSARDILQIFTGKLL
jgi:hypothetical protein